MCHQEDSYALTDAERLRDVILVAIITDEALERGLTRYGQLYSVDFEIASQATVRTNWIVDNGEDFARLISCFVMED